MWKTSWSVECVSQCEHRVLTMDVKDSKKWWPFGSCRLCKYMLANVLCYLILLASTCGKVTTDTSNQSQSVPSGQRPAACWGSASLWRRGMNKPRQQHQHHIWNIPLATTTWVGWHRYCKSPESKIPLPVQDVLVWIMNTQALQNTTRQQLNT